MYLTLRKLCPQRMFSFLIFFSLLLLLPYQYPLKQPFFAVTFCDLIGDHDQNDTNQTLENTGCRTNGEIILADAPFNT